MGYIHDDELNAIRREKGTQLWMFVRAATYHKVSKCEILGHLVKALKRSGWDSRERKIAIKYATNGDYRHLCLVAEELSTDLEPTTNGEEE